MASKSLFPKTGLSRLALPLPMRIGAFKPAQGKVWNRLGSTNASSTSDALHEYFALVWNKPNIEAHIANLQPFKFADEQVQITFFGEMKTTAGWEQTGICFACQAPSEERVRTAILEHEKDYKV
ncbi:hypothetical protein PISL3812_05198 [Talaromyces islandicus]|uniref:Uncharacterized protein n=1 Tax=Talaromyces islandicus TaxID=28573 RepID=A0A0U1LZK9_TALIS|nr:hypothetical protein PISL3812_05198 [Talaromyces islandicus]